MNKTELEILNMYPDILNLYGDIGNLISIEKRCQWRGIDVNIKNVRVNDEIDFQTADIILIGGGSDNGQTLIFKHIMDCRKHLINFIEEGNVVLGICGSYQIFGNSYVNADNQKIPCLEIFDIETIVSKERFTGNILISNNLNSDSSFNSQTNSNLDDIVGFENHGGRIYHNYDVLGEVKVGFGNNGEDGKEGMIYKNFIGSYLHGPLLPKNPHITDHMIFTALKNKYGIKFLKDGMSSLGDIDDSIEIDAYNSMKQRLLKSPLLKSKH